MNECLEKLVSLGICPDEGPSTSGFTLLQAAGMSPKIFANIANENYITGANLAMTKKELAILQLRNDFIGVLQTNRTIAMTANPVYDSSKFNIGASIGLYDGERGVTIHSTHRRGGLRKTKIKNIQLYPLNSGEAVLKIYDGYLETQFEVTLIANQVNTFLADYILDGTTARVLIDQTEINFASAPITCLKGCGGKIPNDCAWVDGWDGTGAVKSEGYGINLQFYCECDYDQVICDIRYMGELLWIKWQILIFDEQLKTNRFNNWVTYNRDELPTIINGLTNQYNTKWNELMNGLFGILKQYQDECLQCRNIRWVTNI